MSIMSIKSLSNMALFTLLYLCSCFINPLILSEAADTISANQTLSGDQTLISSGGNFELGFVDFFSPGEFFRRYYVCIWYKKVKERTVIWVANREAPIRDKYSAQLKLLDGNLVLLNESQIQIWSTNSSSPAQSGFKSVVAILLDNGNLVLRDGSSNSSDWTGFSEKSWESFDNPTHTFMPGAKMGYNKRTQKKTRLTSWKNSEDPSPGSFTLEIDPIKNQFVIMQNGVEYWVSGTWIDRTHIFSLVPEMRLKYIYNYSYVDTENETYFTYSLYDNVSIASRFILGVSGQTQMSSWDEDYWALFWSQPKEQCSVYGYCGAFGLCDDKQRPFCKCLPGFQKRSRSIDYYQFLKDDEFECVREFILPCTNGHVTDSAGRRDRFLRDRSLTLPRNSLLLAGVGKGKCESACLNNCSCTAYAYDEKGCYIWRGGLKDVRKLREGEDRENAIYIRLSASSSVFRGTAKSPKKVILGSIVFAFVLLAVICVVVVYTRRKKKIRTSNAIEGFLVAFGYKDLQNATKNFSIKLGGGGFGSVFRGTLPDSSVIAVKKLESISQGEKQFRAEVSTIGIIQHVNLVRLRGFCVEGTKKLLVYDYMENGSLDSHLFKGSKLLDWKVRHRIALGVARGLAYLHEKCRDCIVHCDIKPENVLLDAEFCPKVADFGLAKLVGRDFSRALTTMRGTLGYLAPEWISGVAITAKADVYSYGMMLFELVSGKRNWGHVRDEENGRYFFPCLAARCVIAEGGDNVVSLVDPKLEGNANAEEVITIFKVACWCVQGDESIRPSMGQVVQILEGIIDVSLPPFPRLLQVLVNESPQTSSTN